MSDTNDRELSDDLVIYRLDSIEKRLGVLGDSIDKLAQVLITRESFNELATDVRDYVRKVDRLEGRVKNLEHLAKIATGVLAVAIGVIVTRLLDLL